MTRVAPGTDVPTPEVVAPQVVADEAAVGEAAAAIIVEGMARANRDGRAYVLGCPAGRSPRTTYAALAGQAAQHDLDLSRLHLVMMDEYVEATPEGWRLCPETAHFSCRGFGEREIRQRLNAGRPAGHQAPQANLHWPNPRDPTAYERLIEALGGVDLFLMASGVSDGHVAFNPPGTTLAEPTRVVVLAETTRRDNLGTFPDFRELSDVPRWGVTISPGAIVRLSRAAILLLPGAARAPALRRVLQGYDPTWPASVIHLCERPAILTDRAAVEAMGAA